MLKGYVPDDGMTEVSGLTGLSSMSGEVINDQDLSGFEPGSVGGSGQSSRRATATPPVPSSPRDSSAGPDPPAEVAPPKKRSSKKPTESAEHRAQAVPAPAGPSVAEVICLLLPFHAHPARSNASPPRGAEIGFVLTALRSKSWRSGRRSWRRRRRRSAG